MAVVNVKKLNRIRDEYPKTYEWMRQKASWEHIALGGVLNGYESYIDELMENEVGEQNEQRKSERTRNQRIQA